MPKISFPSIPRFDLGGGAKKPPISSKPPDVPISRPPSSRPNLDDINTKPTKPSLDEPDVPVVKKPDADGPDANLNGPNPTKPPGRFDGLGRNVLLGGGLVGAGFLGSGGLGSQFINAGAGVANTAVLAEAVKEIFKDAMEALGKFTENPVNLAIVAGVIGVIVLR